MASQKRNRSTQQMGDSDEEPGPSTQSSQKEGGAKRRHMQLPPDIERRKVADVVRYLVCYDIRKVAIKKKVIVDDVLGKEYSGAFDEVMKKADRELRRVFGMKWVELQHPTQKSYILLNVIKRKEREELIDWESSAAQMGLVFVILSLIMMEQTPVSEDTLWGLLKELNIFKDRKHAQFGDVNKLINSELAHQMYLSIEKKVEGDKRVSYFSWGERAHLEVDRRKMLALMAGFHESSFDVWKERYQNILAVEEGRDSEEEAEGPLPMET